jgi:phospholipid/cholesterol/gamma-HCH transport system permease protein
VLLVADYLAFSTRAFLGIGRGAIGIERLRVHATFVQMVNVGVNSFPTVGMACFFMGLVLAMQGADQLQQLGALDKVADLVSFSMLREIGPLITAVVIIGRSGSAITAEIGTMKVNQEIEALEVMAIDPFRFLVVPRLLAMLVMCPCLTMLGIALGLVGGWILGVYSLHLNPYFYVTNTLAAVDLKDLYSGLFKGLVFGGLIATISCYYGMRVEGGAEGVGKNTNRAVVVALLSVLAMDAVLTAFFFFAI